MSQTSAYVLYDLQMSLNKLQEGNDHRYANASASASASANANANARLYGINRSALNPSCYLHILETYTL